MSVKGIYLFGIKIIAIYLNVSKSWKQNTKISNIPKDQWNFVHFFALAFKSGWIKKIKALYCVKYVAPNY